MKRITLICSLLLSVLSVLAQDITMTISEGLSNQSVKLRIERNMAELLNEVNRACATERSLQLEDIDILPSGQKSLQYLWQNLHFYCEDNEIVERCLTSADGYVVRNIHVRLNPVYDNYQDELERALTVRFTREGRIASLALSASDMTYERIVSRGKDVIDMERRQTILGFVENFRSHYDEKDIEALRQVFSDEALIITGSVVMRRDNHGDSPQLRPEVSYKVQTKTEYLRNLKDNFRRNKYIKVTFSDIEVKRHPTKPNFYAVTLRQHWKSSSYEDDGYLVLLWEFRENADPIIHVRTWQPDKVGNRTLRPEEIINIMDFIIP